MAQWRETIAIGPPVARRSGFISYFRLTASIDRAKVLEKCDEITQNPIKPAEVVGGAIVTGIADLPNPIRHQRLLVAEFGYDRPYPSVM